MLLQLQIYVDNLIQCIFIYIMLDLFNSQTPFNYFLYIIFIRCLQSKLPTFRKQMEPNDVHSPSRTPITVRGSIPGSDGRWKNSVTLKPRDLLSTMLMLTLMNMTKIWDSAGLKRGRKYSTKITQICCPISKIWMRTNQPEKQSTGSSITSKLNEQAIKNKETKSSSTIITFY